MWKRRRHDCEYVRQSKRPRTSEHNSYRSQPALSSVGDCVALIRRMSRQEGRDHHADITDLLLKIRAYLFDPNFFEESRQWVNNRIADNNIHDVILFIVNSSRALQKKDNFLDNKDNLINREYEPDYAFFKEMLQNLIKGLSKERCSGWNRSRISAVRSIFYSLFIFLKTGFVSKEAILAVHECILEFLKMAGNDISNASLDEINKVVCNLAELAARRSLKPIKLEYVVVFFTEIMAKKDQAASKDISNIIFYLGKLASEGAFLPRAEDAAQIDIENINSLMRVLNKRKKGQHNEKGVNAYDIANTIYGTSGLAESGILSDSVSMIHVNSLLEISVEKIRIKEEKPGNISNMIYGLCRLARAKRFKMPKGRNVLINLNSINFLLRALVQKKDEVTFVDVSTTLYGIGELAKEKHLIGRMDVAAINSLLEIFNSKIDKLTALSISCAMYGLGELARNNLFDGQINIDKISPLLNQLHKQFQQKIEKSGKLKPCAISNTVGGLSLLTTKGCVQGQINIEDIQDLLNTFVGLGDELKLQQMVSMVYSLGNLAHGRYLKGKIEVEDVNSLLTILSVESEKMSNLEIETIIKGLTQLQPYLTGSIDANLFSILSEKKQKAHATYVERFGRDREELKTGEVLRDEVENSTERVEQSAMVLPVPQENLSLLEYEQELFSFSLDADKDIATDTNTLQASQFLDAHLEKIEENTVEIEFDPAMLRDAFYQELESTAETAIIEEPATAEIREKQKATKEDEKSENEEEIDVRGWPDNTELADEPVVRTNIEMPMDNMAAGEMRHEMEEIAEMDDQIDEDSELEDKIMWGDIDILPISGSTAEQFEMEEVHPDETITMGEGVAASEPTESQMLTEIGNFIAAQDIHGLTRYLEQAEHCCNKKKSLLPSRRISSTSSTSSTASSPGNAYDGLIKKFFKTNRDPQFIRSTGHQYFISLLKRGSWHGFYQLCKKGMLTQLIYHLPIIELQPFIRECITHLVLQKDTDSVIVVTDLLCKRYEKSHLSCDRFAVEELVKSLLNKAFNSHPALNRPKTYAKIKEQNKKCMDRLKTACYQYLFRELPQTPHNANKTPRQRREVTEEIAAILNLLNNLKQPLQQLICENLSLRKEGLLGKGTDLYYINFTWIFVMRCACIHLEKQVAAYQRSRNGNNSQDTSVTAQCAFFANNRALNENNEVRDIKKTLSLLENYVGLYRSKCEKPLGGRMVGGNKWAGQISQFYREYTDKVEQLESQRANPESRTRVSA